MAIKWGNLYFSNNLYFYCIPPRNILDKYTINKDPFRFPISPMIFDKKLIFPTAKQRGIYELIMNLIAND